MVVKYCVDSFIRSKKAVLESQVNEFLFYLDFLHLLHEGQFVDDNTDDHRAFRQAQEVAVL